MAIICQQHNLLFLMAPRTACTAVGKVLCEKLGGKYIPSEGIRNSQGYFSVTRKHGTLQQLLEHHLITSKEADSYLKFTCVRNPFDSLVSLYVKKRSSYQSMISDSDSWIYRVPGYVEDMKFCQNHSFDEWIIKRYRESLIKRIIGRGRSSLYEKYTKDSDVIMRFENLQSDFQYVLDRAGISTEISIPIFNKTSERSTDYQQYYTQKSKQIVESCFRDELEKYNYTF